MSTDHFQTSLELLLNTSRELTTALDINTVLKRVLYLSVKSIGAERGMLIVVDEKQKPEQAAIIFKGQLIRYTVAELYAIIEQGLAGWVLREGKPTLVPNTKQDPRWLNRPDDNLDQTGAKSAICVPLIARESIVGVLTLVHPQPDTFNESHLELLQAIADQAGIAVHNARLYDSLQAATQRYRELFEQNMDPIFITDSNHQILEANHQAVLASGYPIEELIHLSIENLHQPQRDALGIGNLQLNHQATITYESQMRLRDNRMVPVLVYVRKVFTEKGDQVQWILRDITERKELDGMRTDLAAMIYHDLRSPLANVVSSLEMLQAILPPESKQAVQQVYDIASRSIARMSRLITSLLDISRLEAGQPITNQKEVIVAQLIQDALDGVQPTFERKEQKVDLEIEQNLPPIFGDEDMIRRVLINLLDNAAKYTPVSGKIGVKAWCQAGWITLSVEDSGPGIPAEWREAIFEKFSRIQAERFPHGLGLGLAFCRLAVNAHGGRIWVESEVKKGSRFIFTVPITNKNL